MFLIKFQTNFYTTFKIFKAKVSYLLTADEADDNNLQFVNVGKTAAAAATTRSGDSAKDGLASRRRW